MRGHTVFIFALFLPSLLLGQGSVVLVGGGAEAQHGWSDAPYKWIVDHAANKRIAIVSYADEDNWIPDYFMWLGAAAATNIKIDSRTVADLQSTYDNLMSYDAFFFKGGDQSVYYLQYKGTKMMQAAIDKFNAGGVMSGTSAGMAILSGVIYTAKEGSVYPDEALEDVYDPNITLANDLFPFLPGFLADSHFTERGRVGRLLPFLARWYLDNDESISGIGVDDRTALCIEPDSQAEVFGTGTVSFYRGNNYGVVQGEKPVADSIQGIQLLHGDRIDLATLHILNQPSGYVTPLPPDETGNYVVALSGSNELSQNSELLNFLLKENGEVNDTVLVVTAMGRGKAFAQRITDLGGRPIMIETSAALNEASQFPLRNTIRKSTKVLFVENDDNALFSFLQGGPTGELLDLHLRRNGIVTAFAGEDSRYAGRSFTINHRTDQYAAYYGRLAYRKGLSLLSTSTIMANTYDPNTTNYYENTTAAVSYTMMTDSLRYGIYLNRGNVLRYAQQNGRSFFTASGSRSVIILVNNGTEVALASQPVSDGNGPRNYASFAAVKYVLLNGAATLAAGIPHISDDAPHKFEYPVVGVESEIDQSSLHVFPNPSVNGIFHFSGTSQVSRKFEVSVADVIGRIRKKQNHDSLEQVVDLSDLEDGIYLLRIDSGTEVRVIKVIKH